jgi:hypothetical protein
MMWETVQPTVLPHRSQREHHRLQFMRRDIEVVALWLRPCSVLKRALLACVACVALWRRPPQTTGTRERIASQH